MSRKLSSTRCRTSGGNARRWGIATILIATVGLAGLIFAATDHQNIPPKSDGAKAKVVPLPVSPEAGESSQGASATETSPTSAGQGSQAAAPKLVAAPAKNVAAPNAAPANDDCSGAIVIPDGTFPVVSAVTNVSEATPQGADEGLQSCAASDYSVWYSFTPSVTAGYVFSTCQGNGATGSTVYDTVLGIFPSTGGACPQGAQIACNDTASGCTTSGGGAPYWDQSTLSAVLVAGQTYFIVASHWAPDTGGVAPGFDNVAVKVDLNPAPLNDTCAGAIPLTLNQAVVGTTAAATNDYLSPSNATCFPGVGQTPSTSGGRDVVYSFTAPSAGSYSFRIYGQAYPTDIDTTQNLDIYVATNCPASGTVSCIGGGNRMVSAVSTAIQNRGEEAYCVPLAASQTVYAYVDHATAANPGSPFRIDVFPCTQEVEPNNTPATANSLACLEEGSINPAGDADFFSLGNPPAGSRVFAFVDGITSNTNDYDLRVTTDTDTLEFDADFGISTQGGSTAPGVGGTPLTGVPAYLRVNHKNAATAAEPYRIMTVVQPPSASAIPEPPEPNFGFFRDAGSDLSNYFRGNITSGDVDSFRFCANQGDMIFSILDADPLRDATAFDPAAFMFDYTGAQIFGVSDADAVSIQTPSPGTLVGNTPRSPAEALAFRAAYTGLYLAAFNQQAGVGDYLASIVTNCGNPVLSSDPQVTISGPSGTVATSSTISYTITVTNPGTSARDVRMVDVLPPNLLFVDLSAFGSVTSGLECDTPAVGSSGTVDCMNFCVAAGDTLTYTLTVRVAGCIGSGVNIVNGATISSLSADTNPGNNSASTSNLTTDDGTCSDSDACTSGDHCEGSTCVTTPVDCDDHSVCTDDSCDTVIGCINDPSPGEGCDDGFPCTSNTCDPVDGCQFPNAPAGGACNDFFPCTGPDLCDGNGSCVGAPVTCDDGNPCTDDSCDSGTGDCIHTPTAAGTGCADGDACVTGDTCDGAGTCVAGSGTLDCNDNNPCTDDSCSPSTGCVYTNNSNPCSDGNACTTGDTCGGGTCNAGPALVCNDGNVCTTDTCNPGSGCVYTNNTNSCDDGNACTTGDTCGGGTCNGGSALVCNDGNGCTNDSCNPGSGCVFTSNGSCSSQITSTSTCAGYRSGSAQDLPTATYMTKGSKINSVNPGVMFYWATIVAPAASFTYTVDQDVAPSTCVFPDWPVLSPQNSGHIDVYTASCGNRQSSSSFDPTTGTVTISVTGATPGETLVVGIKYDNGLKGTNVCRPHPAETYTFSDSVGNSDTLVFVPKN